METSPAGWAARVCTNLFPLSVEQHDLSKALKEWAHTEEVIDHGPNANEVCEMCGKKPLRFHFEIENANTRFKLWVGSECINRFGVDVILEDGTRITGKEAAKHVLKTRARMIEDARKGRVADAIMDVIDLENKDHLRPILNACLAKHREGKALSPKLMNTLAWRLKTFKVPHSPSDFRVALRRASHRYDLGSLDDFQAKGLIPYLAPAQREYLLSTRPQLEAPPVKQVQVQHEPEPRTVDTKTWDEIFASL